MIKAKMTMLTIIFSIGASFFYQLPTPMPLEMAINEDTQQCAKVILGDECMICTLPEGWEIIGRYLDIACPAGYEMIALDLDCVDKEDCQWNIVPVEKTSNKPNLIIIGSIFGLICFGLVVLVVVSVLLIWLLKSHKKSTKYPFGESE